MSDVDTLIKDNKFSGSVTIYANGQSHKIDYRNISFNPNYLLDPKKKFLGKKKKVYGRDKLAEELHTKFLGAEGSYIVSVVAMGGLGKTAFSNRYKELYEKEYKNIHHLYLNNSIYGDFIQNLSSVFGVGFRQCIEGLSDVDKKEKIIEALEKIPVSPNLLILDINVKSKSEFVTDFLDSFERLSEKWHVLLLSRKEFSDFSNLDKKDHERMTLKFDSLASASDDAVEMFKAICPNIECSNDDLKDIFATRGFDYHPLLIEALAACCKRKEFKNASQIRNAIDLSQSERLETLSKELKRDEELGTVYTYLYYLIDFDDYDEYSQILLRHFILWPYSNIPENVICNLLRFYIEAEEDFDPSIYLKSLVNDMVLSECEEEYRIYGMSIDAYWSSLLGEEPTPEIVQTLIDAIKNRQLGTAVSQCIGYRMHDLMERTLAKKAIKEKFCYDRYFDGIRRILVNPCSIALLRTTESCLFESLYTNAKTEILCPPDDLYLLAAAHYDCYAADGMKKAVVENALNAIKTFDFKTYSDNLNFVADALHDFSIVIYVRNQLDDVDEILKNVIVARETLCAHNDTADNRLKLALEHYTLGKLTNQANEVAKGQLWLDEVCSMMFIPEMVDVEGGNYDMGSNDYYDYAKPVHNVTVSDFQIGKYPVTQQQWDYLMVDDIPSVSRCDIHRGLGPDYPIYNISWYEAAKFCNKLSKVQGFEEVYVFDEKDEIVISFDNKKHGYRLPTEAEWEYAARGGQFKENYLYCGSDTLDVVAWFDVNSHASTHRVGEKNNPNSLGLHDMSGNVYEWCQDAYEENYYEECLKNPKLCDNPCNVGNLSSGSSRVLRGGSWSFGADFCRVSNRNYFNPDHRDISCGMRLALPCSPFPSLKK